MNFCICSFLCIDWFLFLVCNVCTFQSYYWMCFYVYCSAYIIHRGNPPGHLSNEVTMMRKKICGGVLDTYSLRMLREKKDIFYPFSLILYNTKPVGHQVHFYAQLICCEFYYSILLEHVGLAHWEIMRHICWCAHCYRLDLIFIHDCWFDGPYWMGDSQNPFR